MVTLPGGRFWSFCCCAAVLGVITLKPDATSMLSLFCVLVDVLAQLANNRVHAAMIVTSTIGLISFIGFSVVVLIIERQMNASEGNSSGDLRTVSDRIEKKSVILVVDAECAITDLSENATGEVDPDNGPAVDAPRHERIYACPELSLF